MNIQEHIAIVKDFPKKGIIFKDITPLFLNPKAFSELIDELAKKIEPLCPTKILAAEARGFLFGAPLAIKTGLPFVPVRKKGKLPRETIEANYALEYGIDTLCIHKEDVCENDRVIVFDDILATGGTAKAICELVESRKASIEACLFLMELSFLHGREKLAGKKVISMLVE